MKRTYIGELKKHVGKKTTIIGWVSLRRDHGKLIFFDVRDRSGSIQVVALPDQLRKAYSNPEKIRSEWILQIEGKIKNRPQNMVNPAIENGDIEIEAMDLDVLNEAKTPPFDLLSDGKEISEEVRLNYRYLDLRRPRLQKNIKKRAEVTKFFRDYLNRQGFIEIETPILTKSTPEGARDYVVPSRLEKGKFYALPQSPQQYKQLLMIAGFEKYFQIARCMRDEDTRGDRQPEFTQLDLETSFISKKRDVLALLALIEKMVIKLVDKTFPEKKIIFKPFKKLTYDETIKKYNSDRPDLRENKENSNELAFAWITDFPMFEKRDDGTLAAAHHPFTLPKSHLSDDPYYSNHDSSAATYIRDVLKNKKESELLKLKAFQYDLVCNGYEIGGGSIRTDDKGLLQLVFGALNHTAGEINTKFGHLLKAFDYGVPHGGIAMGLDRFIAILLDEPNIREVIAFPKTGEGRDLMMNAPAEISDEQLKELGLKLEK